MESKKNVKAKNKLKSIRTLRKKNDDQSDVKPKGKRNHSSNDFKRNNVNEETSQSDRETFCHRVSHGKNEDTDGACVAETSSKKHQPTINNKGSLKKIKLQRGKDKGNSYVEDDCRSKKQNNGNSQVSNSIKYVEKGLSNIPKTKLYRSTDKNVNKRQGNKRNLLEKEDKMEDTNESSKMDNNGNTGTLKPIKNAFAFMMDNRHKVVGQNSPGKVEEQVEESSTSENKEKLAARKVLFQNWADLKGAKKRKVVDHELGITIDYKLKQRAKRFKKMLAPKQSSEHSEHSPNFDSDKTTTPQNLHSGITKQTNTSSRISDCNIVSENRFKNINKNFQQTDLVSFFGNPAKSKSEKACEEKMQDVSEKRCKKFNKKGAYDKSITSDLSNHKKEISDGIDASINKKHSSQSFLTPKSLPKWQMKLRWSLEGLDDEAIENLIEGNSSSKKLHTNKATPLKTINENNTIDSDSVKNVGSKHSKVKCKTEIPKHLQSAISSSDKLVLVKDSKNSNKNSKKTNDAVKLAPVFLKAAPRPKPDKQTLMERKKFLHSEMPAKLRQIREKEKVLQERPFSMFPTISHVTVQPNQEQLCNSVNFWKLPSVTLELHAQEVPTPEIGILKLGSLTNCTTANEIVDNNNCMEFQKVLDIKKEIKKIKNENQNYPVLKSFRFFSSKQRTNNYQQVTPQQTMISGKRSSKSKSKNFEDWGTNAAQTDLFTDLYKPCSADEMFSNYSNVRSIKKWLQIWIEYSDEINKNIRKRRNSDSSNDFELTDADSRHSVEQLPGNTLILWGPHGSGKTSAVYAVCNELGIVVLESNASSKRTGKLLLQDFQESSQSRGVPEFQTGIQSVVKKDSANTALQKKMHLLFIEDVDIVFNQDENFLSALNQLIGISKRPIILTTTDLNCIHLKKLALQHTTIEFSRISANVLAPWLQVLCVNEGVCVEKQFLAELLQHCKGDVRSTLLLLEFLIRSSGVTKITNDISMNETDSNMSSTINDDSKVYEFVDNKIDFINRINGDRPLDLGHIWWSIPQFFKMPKCDLKCDKSTDLIKTSGIDSGISSQTEMVPANEDLQKSIELDSKAFFQISQLFDDLAMTDVAYNKSIDCDLEPVHKNRSLRIKRSLEQDHPMDDFSYFYQDLTIEISHTLVNGYTCDTYSISNITQDRGTNKKRWRTKQYKCDEILLEAVPPVHHLDRVALMDYFATLRAITKSESARAGITNKRMNRFYNYLSSLGISFNDSILETANNVFLRDF